MKAGIETFMTSQLVQKRTIPLFEPIKKQNPRTFSHINKCVVTISDDVKKKLIWKRVNMENIHELACVPLSLAYIWNNEL